MIVVIPEIVQKNINNFIIIIEEKKKYRKKIHTNILYLHNK